MANTGKDASGNTIFLLAPFGTGVDNANAYVFGSSIYFQRDTAAQLPILDVVSPANNRPLPVVCLAGDGLAAYDTDSGAAGSATLRVVTTPDTRQGSNGDAASKTGSNAAQLRAIADLLDGTANKTSTVPFTISTGQSLSDTIDIGAGKTLLALVFPSAWNVADLFFNVHPTVSGSVCQKLTESGTRYRLTQIPVAATSNYRIGATNFLGDRFIQLASVTAAGAPQTQSATRTILGLVGVI